MTIAVVAFFCGVIVGAVAVALQRAAAIERIKQQFRVELEAILVERAVASEPIDSAMKPPQSSEYDPGRAA